MVKICSFADKKSSTKHGGYIIDWDKVRTYVVPKNLKDFKVTTNTLYLTTLLRGAKLTPFVARTMKPHKGRFEGDPKGAFSGEAYLARWKEENGED
jgi:large subunit ribosomal protein L41